MRPDDPLIADRSGHLPFVELPAKPSPNPSREGQNAKCDLPRLIQHALSLASLKR